MSASVRSRRKTTKEKSIAKSQHFRLQTGVRIIVCLLGITVFLGMQAPFATLRADFRSSEAWQLVWQLLADKNAAEFTSSVFQLAIGVLIVASILHALRAESAVYLSPVCERRLQSKR